MTKECLNQMPRIFKVGTCVKEIKKLCFTLLNFNIPVWLLIYIVLHDNLQSSRDNKTVNDNKLH